MSNKKKIISLVYKFIAFTCAIVGIALCIGLFSNNVNFEVLKYYTLLSNIFCAIYFLGSIIMILTHYKENPPKEFLKSMKGAIVMGITVTMLVFHFMLSDAYSAYNSYGTTMISNYLLHYVVPILTIGDWLFFDKKGDYSKWQPFLWITPPYIYFAFVLFGANFTNISYMGSKYPYPFIDIDKLGLEKVTSNILLLTIVFLVLGYIFLFIDNLIAKKMPRYN